MKININYPRLAAEFVIVVTGVAAALAADGWRQDAENRGIEKQYVDRLITELNVGHSLLQAELRLVSNSKEHIEYLIENLTSDANSVSDEQLLDHFAQASRMTYSPGRLLHDNTFNELLTTGRLALFSDPEVLVALSSYFSFMDSLDFARENTPRTVLYEYMKYTGMNPGVNSWEELPPYARERATRGLRENGELLDELLYVNARFAGLNEGGAIQRRIDRNRDLVQLLSR